MSDEFTLVCGSALIDVIATIEENNPPVEHRGPISIEFGGSAYNIAINMQKLGTHATFVSAMNASPFSKLCANQLHMNDVRTYIKELPDMPDAVYAGIFNNGEQTTAVTTTSIEDYDFLPEDSGNIVKSSSCVVMSCDLSESTLTKLAEDANKNDVPVFVVGLSRKETLKIPSIKAAVDYCFLTEQEMDYLAATHYQSNDWSDVAAHLDVIFLVAMGKKGVAVVTAAGREVYTTDSIAVTGNTRGAGDLLLSCIVHYHIFDDYDIGMAIERSFDHMDEIFKRKHANLGDDKSIAINIQTVINTANQDKLTGALNRHGLESIYKSYDPQQTNRYLLLMDIDHFKSVNDTYGHDVGDEVLKIVASTLRDTLRDNDVLGRWGGEEFICLIQAFSMNDALSLANRIREKVSEVDVPQIDRNITLSGGVAHLDLSQSIEIALKEADGHLYKAKEAGRNRILPEPEIIKDFDLDLDM